MTNSAEAVYPHLRGKALEIVEKSNAERIRFIYEDRWIGYPRAVEAVRRLEELYNWPKKRRMPNLLLVGPTNNGKTMIIERFLRNHSSRPGRVVDRVDVLAIQMPGEGTISRFYSSLLDGLGAPHRPQSRTSELARLTMTTLSATGVKMLIIDEFHNLLSAPTSARHDFLNVLRYIGNEAQIPIVGVGTSAAYLAIQSDPQLENRFAPFKLTLWNTDEEFLSLLASFESSFPLKRPSEIVNTDMATYLLARSEGTIGELCTLLSSAAIVAIESGEESINASTLSQSAYQGPQARREDFSR